MRIFLALFFLLPSLCVAQIKLATGGPISGESQIFSQGRPSKLEVNQWIKGLDEIENLSAGVYETKFKDGSRIQNQGPARIGVISEKNASILKGCIIADLRDKFKISQKEIAVSSTKMGSAYICFKDNSLLAVSIQGDIDFYKNEVLLGTVRDEEFAIYDFINSRLSPIELIDRSQYFEIQNKPIPSQVTNLEKLVPYGLNREIVKNDNDVLLEEMKQINSEVSKLKFEEPNSFRKDGTKINFLKEKKISIGPLKRNFFYQPPLEIEKKTGGVRGIFDPQRFEEIKK